MTLPNELTATAPSLAPSPCRLRKRSSSIFDQEEINKLDASTDEDMCKLSHELARDAARASKAKNTKAKTPAASKSKRARASVASDTDELELDSAEKPPLPLAAKKKGKAKKEIFVPDGVFAICPRITQLNWSEVVHLHIPDSRSETVVLRRVSIPLTSITFDNVLVSIWSAIGCTADDVKKKPSLSYKLVTATVKEAAFALDNNDTWDGLVAAAATAAAKKNSIVEVNIIVPNQVSNTCIGAMIYR
jgi:hypothetical protein